MAESCKTLTSEQFERESEEARFIRAARQDPRAFGELYKLYVNHVFKYLCSRVGNVHDAEDITAQTFLAAFEAFDRFHRDGNFAPWLFAIARNKATDHFRQHKNSTSIDAAGDFPVDSDPLTDMIRSEQAAALSKLIHDLPEEEQELLRLRFLAGMSFPQIALLFHHNEDAVKKTIYRLLARLQSQLEVSNE